MKRSASAPASLMICGEHAVVYGEKAIVAAIDARLHLEMTLRNDHQIQIESALARHETNLEARQSHPKLQFVMRAIQRAELTQGFDLTIKSHIPHQMGLGSSAAVTAAMVALLHPRQNADFWQREALQVVLDVQKRGSGADVAASVHGGILAYFPQEDLRVEALPWPPAPFSVRYAGYKTPTAEVLAMLAQRPAMEKARDTALYRHMGKISQQAISAAQKQDWTLFYQQLNAYQEALAILGVCDEIQAEHIRQAQAESYASKISGSGLGDCILAFAEALPAQHQALNFTAQGVLLSEAL